jgi:hypothetical protein
MACARQRDDDDPENGNSTHMATIHVVFSPERAAGTAAGLCPRTGVAGGVLLNS